MTATTSERPPLRRGWAVVASKELADHFLSARFTVLMLVLGLIAAAAVAATATLINDNAQAASVIDSVFLRIYTEQPSEQIPFTFVDLVGVLLPFVGIAFGFDAINGERAQGTLPRLLSQPLHRDDVINGKFVAGMSVVTALLVSILLLTAGVGVFQLGILPDASEVVRLLAWLVVSVAYVGFWQGVATLTSVVARRAATSVLIMIGVWFLIAVILPLFTSAIASFVTGGGAADPVALESTRQTIARAFPSTLYAEATSVLLNPQQATTSSALSLNQLVQLQLRFPSELPVGQSLLLVIPQIVVLVALTVMTFGIAYVAFMRQEVRA